MQTIISNLGNRLKDYPGLRKIAGNTGWLMFNQLTRMTVGLVVGVWIARYLGTRQFGMLNYAIALVGMVGAVVTLGLNKICVRSIVRHPQNRDMILGTAFLLQCLAGIATFAIIAFYVKYIGFEDEPTQVLALIVALGLTVKCFETIDTWFESQVKSKYPVYSRIAAFLLVATVRIVLILAQAPLVAFAWAILVETLLATIGLVIVYKRTGGVFRSWSFSIKEAKRLLSESWPLVLSAIAITIYMKIDIIMLGNLVGDEAVGIYSAATRISEVWYFIPTAIVASVAPALIKVQKQDRNMYFRRLQQLFSLMVAISLLIAVPLSFISNNIINCLYGTEYRGAGLVLSLHIWAAIFVFLGVAQTQYFVNEGLTRLPMFRTLGGAVANVGLNLYLIPLYGPVGAAISTVVSYAVSVSFANLLDSRTRFLFIFQINAFVFRGLLKLKG